MSEEQVPSAPVELLNGKPEMTSFTLGVKTLGTPLNNWGKYINFTIFLPESRI
jgi:hypothetical protein